MYWAFSILCDILIPAFWYSVWSPFLLKSQFCLARFAVLWRSCSHLGCCKVGYTTTASWELPVSNKMTLISSIWKRCLWFKENNIVHQLYWCVTSFWLTSFIFRWAERSLFAQGHVKMISIFCPWHPFAFQLFKSNFLSTYWSDSSNFCTNTTTSSWFIIFQTLGRRKVVSLSY